MLFGSLTNNDFNVFFKGVLLDIPVDQHCHQVSGKINLKW